MTPEMRAAAIVARAFNIQGEVAPEADMASLPAWDSMNHVALMLEVEQELGRKLAPEDMVTIDSVRAIARLFATETTG